MYLPHQQRVIDEHAELSARLVLLDAFVTSNPIFDTLPSGERERLLRQRSVMGEYADILQGRIAAFTP